MIIEICQCDMAAGGVLVLAADAAEQTSSGRQQALKRRRAQQARQTRANERNLVKGREGVWCKSLVSFAVGFWLLSLGTNSLARLLSSILIPISIPIPILANDSFETIGTKVCLVVANCR